jgi:O-antigen ligase/polysaccharide polymerase Wzy-like membrane protein
MNTAAYLNDEDAPLELAGWVLLSVVVGYVCMTRSFAHIGVSPLYIGEATLGALLIFWPGTICGTWFRAQLRPNAYTRLTTFAAIFVAYGFLQCLRGLSTSSYPKIAVQNFAFNYYIAFLFAGMGLAERHPKLLPRLLWILAWVNAIYGIAYLLKFGPAVPVEERDPSVIPIFGWPAGSAIAILGLLAFVGNKRRIIIPLLLNAFVLIGQQVRAEWVAFALAIFLFSVLSRRLSRLIASGLIIGGLIISGLIVDFKIYAPSGLGGVISMRDSVGRAVAIVDEDAAARLTEHAATHSGSVSWRSDWWRNLVELTHKREATTLFGMGYGYPIWEENSIIRDVNPTPHNIFIFVLTYTGWVGVVIFYTLQLYLAWLLWKAYRASGQPFGICLWVLLFAWAHFDNRLETPYGAIPFWVLTGMALVSAFATASDAREKLHVVERQQFFRVGTDRV